jgi:hypothetical protein
MQGLAHSPTKYDADQRQISKPALTGYATGANRFDLQSLIVSRRGLSYFNLERRKQSTPATS